MRAGVVIGMAVGSCGAGRDRGLIPRFLVVLVRTSTSSDTIQTAHTNFFLTKDLVFKKFGVPLHSQTRQGKHTDGEISSVG